MDLFEIERGFIIKSYPNGFLSDKLVFEILETAYQKALLIK